MSIFKILPASGFSDGTRLRIQFQFNLFIKQEDRSATYIDMHKIHVEKL